MSFEWEEPDEASDVEFRVLEITSEEILDVCQSFWPQMAVVQETEGDGEMLNTFYIFPNEYEKSKWNFDDESVVNPSPIKCEALIFVCSNCGSRVGMFSKNADPDLIEALEEFEVEVEFEDEA